MKGYWRWRRASLTKKRENIQHDPIAHGYKDLADAELRLINLHDKIRKINNRLNDQIDPRSLDVATSFAAH